MKDCAPWSPSRLGIPPAAAAAFLFGLRRSVIRARGLTGPIDVAGCLCGWRRAAIIAIRPPVSKPSIETEGSRSWFWSPSRSRVICSTEGLSHFGELPWFLASGMMMDLLVTWWIFFPMLVWFSFRPNRACWIIRGEEESFLLAFSYET